jgi:hypothetical protein
MTGVVNEDLLSFHLVNKVKNTLILMREYHPSFLSHLKTTIYVDND